MVLFVCFSIDDGFVLVLVFELASTVGGKGGAKGRSGLSDLLSLFCL